MRRSREVAGADRMGDGNIELKFTSDPGVSTCFLWATTNVVLPLASWTQIGSGPITNSPMTIQDLTATKLSAALLHDLCAVNSALHRG